MPQTAVASTFGTVQPQNHNKEKKMDTITVKDGTKIYYKDWGTGQPLFFHHGWPLSADDWDAQMMFLRERGHRVVAHDRRGHGSATRRRNERRNARTMNPPWAARSSREDRTQSGSRRMHPSDVSSFHHMLRPAGYEPGDSV